MSLLIIIIIIINIIQYAGFYDEMQDLEVGVVETEASELLGPSVEPEKKTYSKEEEEALLPDLDGDGAGAGQGCDNDEEMQSDGEEERRREGRLSLQTSYR
jgi:hypothetical protein